MIDKITNEFLSYVSSTFSKYSISYDILYNSDLEMVSQYSKSLSVRSLFSQGDLSLIKDDDFENLKNKDYILCMYNYLPLKKVDDRFNNLDYEIVLNPNLPDGESFGKFSELKDSGVSEDNLKMYHLIRESNKEITELSGQVRDMIYGEIGFNFKFMTSNTESINDIQFIHNKTLQRNKSYIVKLSFDKEDIEFDYKTYFEPIDSVGHIDYNQYGNLQHLTFSARIEGVFFSFYKKSSSFLDRIDLSVKNL